MIKGINSSSRHLIVSGGQPGGNYISPGAVGSGMMRYNGNTHSIEINDGNSWQTMQTNYATIELTPDTESLLDWARKERDKQWTREAKMKSNPALKKAYEAIIRAEENYDLLESIAGDYQAENGVTQSS